MPSTAGFWRETILLRISPDCTQPENPWVAATAPTVWEETLSWRPRYLESFANAAADYAKARGNTDDVTSEESLAMIEQACYSKERQGKMPPEKAMEAVQKIVQKAAFLERTEEKLNEGIRSLERLREAYAPMRFWIRLRRPPRFPHTMRSAPRF